MLWEFQRLVGFFYSVFAILSCVFFSCIEGYRITPVGGWRLCFHGLGTSAAFRCVNDPTRRQATSKCGDGVEGVALLN